MLEILSVVVLVVVVGLVLFLILNIFTSTGKPDHKGPISRD